MMLPSGTNCSNVLSPGKTSSKQYGMKMSASITVGVPIFAMLLLVLGVGIRMRRRRWCSDVKVSEA